MFSGEEVRLGSQAGLGCDRPEVMEGGRLCSVGPGATGGFKPQCHRQFCGFEPSGWLLVALVLGEGRQVQKRQF